MRSLVAGFAVLLLAGAAVAAEDAGKTAFDKSTLESYVRYMLMWGPQINVSVSDPTPSEVKGLQDVTVRGSAGPASLQMVLRISDDGQKIVQGNIFDIATNPFQNDLDKLSTYMEPSMGTPGAPVSLVMFSDFECAYCKQEVEELRKNLLTTYPEQVRLYFKDYPLEAIHTWAKAAAIAGQCVYGQTSDDGFWAYVDWVYSQQSSITDTNLRSKLMEFAAQQGNLDTLKLGTCFDQRQTEKDIDGSIAEGQALQINSTPTLFVNGRRFATELPWQNLKQIIDFELQNGDLLGGSEDEDCCTVELPTPMSQ